MNDETPPASGNRWEPGDQPTAQPADEPDRPSLPERWLARPG